MTREVIKKKNTMTIRDVIEENVPNKFEMNNTIIPTPIIQGLNFSEKDKVKYYDDLKRKNVNLVVYSPYNKGPFAVRAQTIASQLGLKVFLFTRRSH